MNTDKLMGLVEAVALQADAAARLGGERHMALTLSNIADRCAAALRAEQAVGEEQIARELLNAEIGPNPLYPLRAEVVADAAVRAIRRALGTARQSDEPRAPVQGYHGETIPWRVHGLAWEAYAKEYGRGQSAKRIAERGGFGCGEMDKFLPGWRDMAHAIDHPARQSEGVVLPRKVYPQGDNGPAYYVAKDVDAMLAAAPGGEGEG